MAEYSRQPVKGLQFDLLDLAPEGKVLEGDLDCAEFELDDLPRRAFAAPIHYKLKLTPINGAQDLLVQGSLSSCLVVVCDRCDEEFSWPFSVDEVCHEYENAFGTTVDLTDDLREDILVSFPQHFLCRDDCQGLCPRCGKNLNDGPCECEESSLEDESSAQAADESDNPWQRLDSLDLSK